MVRILARGAVVAQERTAGAMRAMQRAAALAEAAGAAEIGPAHLLVALWLDETRAAELLQASGITAEHFRGAWPDTFGFEESATPDASPGWLTPTGSDVEAVRQRAAALAAAAGRHVEVGTEHLLLALAQVPSPVSRMLAGWGVERDALAAAVAEASGVTTEPIAVDFTLESAPPRLTDATDTLRLLDAAANRCREGLRAVEDFVRFALDDRHLTELLKAWRHDLATALADFDVRALIAARDTGGDVGTTVRTAAEDRRGSAEDVVIANLKRVQEAVRSLEEYGKMVSVAAGRAFESLRYRSYTLEKAVLGTLHSRRRLEGRVLYLLLTISQCRRGLDAVLQAAFEQGVSVIQIREKSQKTLPDRELLAHARRLRKLTGERGLLLIVNDRPDLAVLSGADGVHVGQEELSVRDVRRIIGPDRLVGVSTHSIAQARQAVIDGADYLGVGPVFPSGTKAFDAFAGLELVREVAAEITRPWFAIGGITAANLAEVTAAGAGRIAVSAAICRADDPAAATRALRSRLP